MRRLNLIGRVLAAFTLSMFIANCGGGGASTWHPDSGIKASDPHVTGTRDMNYDHQIIAGERVGPVRLGGLVSEAVRHLGEPDRVNRSAFRGPGYSADEVYYFYTDECINFTWQDSGIDPTIENGLRGINVTCDKWSTPEGLHVGSSMSEVNAHLGKYCPETQDDGSMVIETKEGVWYWAKDRNSPVTEISVMPVMDHWDCKD